MGLSASVKAHTVQNVSHLQQINLPMIYLACKAAVLNIQGEMWNNSHNQWIILPAHSFASNNLSHAMARPRRTLTFEKVCLLLAHLHSRRTGNATHAVLNGNLLCAGLHRLLLTMFTRTSEKKNRLVQKTFRRFFISVLHCHCS